MIWTNRLNLPQPIVDAVKNDSYNRGVAQISITGLIAPPRQRVLKKIHEAELTEDISDNIFSLVGQVMHGILERANKDALSEKRFYHDIEGITISGQADAYYEAGLLQDYKFVSLFAVKDGVKLEYEQQLNAYVYLIEHGYTLESDPNQPGELVKTFHNYKVTTAEDVFILRDWTKGKARQDRDLPQQQVLKLGVPLWTEVQQLAFLVERINLHKAANKKLPDCTDDERWADPDKWAVMPKPDAARSLKNHTSKEDAEEHVANSTGKYPKAFVEFRPGVNKRCEDYCIVAEHCSQFKKLKNKE